MLYEMLGDIKMICKFNLTYLTFITGPLPDPHIMASGEKLQDIWNIPGISATRNFQTAAWAKELNFVDSKFGPVPFGSVFSYQCPPEIGRNITKHPGAPEFPQLPVEDYNFKFQLNFEPNYKQQCHLESLNVSKHISGAIEAETQLQSECQLWTQVRKPRLTASRFGEICHVRRESSSKALAARILRGTPQSAAVIRGLDLEPDILRQYSDFCDVSVMQCGMSQIHYNHNGTKKITCVLSKRLPSYSTDSNHNEVL